MIAKWKAQLRAWLVLAMREAIRIERTLENPYRATPRIPAEPIRVSGQLKDYTDAERRMYSSNSNATWDGDNGLYPMRLYDLSDSSATPQVAEENPFKEYEHRENLYRKLENGTLPVVSQKERSRFRFPISTNEANTVSFERMQANALAEQEKYYEPKQ